MAGSIEEAGVRFIVENLESYLAQVKLANGATAGIGDSATTAAARHGIAWKAMGTAAVAGAAIIAAAAVGVGLVALKLAGDFDDAYDSIQVKTGATGAELEGLKESFKAVFSSIPADGGDISLALAAIAQKTGATGPALETLTAQIVELSRITGTDLNANIEAVLGATQRWGLSAEAAAPMLDHLFRISQESGVPVAELAASLQDNKAVLDALGLTLPQAAELIGGLGKSGIDADTAFQGLTIALRKMAKDGIEDPAAEIQKYFDRIKNAKTDAEATAIGVDIFGRSAVGLASAIRDGTFDMEAFTKAVGENKNGIIDTAEATADWQEKLTLLKNKALVALEPALMAIFTAVSDGVEEVGPALERFSAWFSEEIQPAIAEATAVFKTDWLPVIERVGKTLRDFWEQVGEPILRIWGENMRAIGAVFKEVALLIGAIIDGDFSAALEHLKAIFSEAFNAIVTIITGYAESFKAAALFIFGQILEALGTTQGELIADIAGLFSDVVTAITSFAGAMLSAGRELFEAVSDGIMSVPILGDVIGIGVDIANAVAGWATGMFSRGYDVMIGVLDGLKSAWQAILDWVSNLPSLTDLLPDILGATPLDLVIPIRLDFQVEPLSPNWLLDWFNEEQDKERQRALLEEAWQAWLEQHPLELTPEVKPGDPSIFVPEDVIEDWQEYLDDHPLDITPVLKPDTPEMLDFSIPEDSQWLLDWFNKQQDAERLKEQLEEALEAWLKEHPLEITPDMKIKIPERWKPAIDLELDKPPKKPKRWKPGDDDKPPGGGGTTDPGQLLALVMQAIATIEAIAGSDLAPVNKQKLMGIAQSLRAIVVEFSNAMRGIEPEAVEAAALIADFISPILQAINDSVDILSNEAISKFGGANLAGFRTLLANMAELALAASQTIGSLNIEASADGAVSLLQEVLGTMSQALDILSDPRFGSFGGANMAGYRTLFANMAELTQIGVDTLAGFDVATVTSVADVLQQIGRMVDLLTHIVGAGDGSGGGAGGGSGGGGFDPPFIPGPDPGPDPGPIPIPIIDDILSRISGSLPGVGANLAGLQGGVTYQVSAVYTNPQSPQSIRLDLEAIAMMASA